MENKNENGLAAIAATQPEPRANVIIHAAAAKEIIHHHVEARKSAKNALQHAMLAGERLIAIKQSLPHGQWGPWLLENIPDLDPRQARRYMAYASHRDLIESSPDPIESLAGAYRVIKSDKRVRFAEDVSGERRLTDPERARLAELEETIQSMSDWLDDFGDDTRHRIESLVHLVDVLPPEDFAVALRRIVQESVPASA